MIFTPPGERVILRRSWARAERELVASAVAAGDFNGDSTPDIVAGAPGYDIGGLGYVVFGPNSGTFSLSDADVVLSGDGDDEAGSSIASVGDIDGDGCDCDDLLVAGARTPAPHHRGTGLLARRPDHHPRWRHHALRAGITHFVATVDTTSIATSALAAAHAALLVRLAGVGAPVPVNRGGSGGGSDLLLRDLDCAVLNFHLRDLDKARGLGGPYYQTVRGVFVEGMPAFPGGSIFTKTHTQVAVRDPAVIVGYFRPSRYTGPGA